MSPFVNILIACVLGFVLDLIFGEHFTRISPAVLFGKLIAKLEPFMRNVFVVGDWHEREAGVMLVLTVCFVAAVGPMVIVCLVWMISPFLHLVLETFWCYQIMATCALHQAGLKVYRCLIARDLPAARLAVGEIVGRDTDQLDTEGVTKATVETVAENTSDGAIAPMFYFIIGGAPLSLLYKAINTMDSMLGYKNERYIEFGWCAAKLDDVANYLPARLSAFLIMACAGIITTFSGRGAYRIWKRDRRNSPSPNSAQTESAVAGALGIQLLGDAVYFGQLMHKKTVGDATRPVEPMDIIRSGMLLYASTGMCTVVGVILRAIILAVA